MGAHDAVFSSPTHHLNRPLKSPESRGLNLLSAACQHHTKAGVGTITWPRRAHCGSSYNLAVNQRATCIGMCVPRSRHRRPRRDPAGVRGMPACRRSYFAILGLPESTIESTGLFSIALGQSGSHNDIRCRQSSHPAGSPDRPRRAVSAGGMLFQIVSGNSCNAATPTGRGACSLVDRPPAADPPPGKLRRRGSGRTGRPVSG